MTEYAVVLELDTAAPDEAGLIALIGALPGGSSAARLPDGRLRLGVTLNTPDVTEAARLAAHFAPHALQAAGLPAAPTTRVVAERADLSDARTDAILDRLDRLPPLVSVTEAATILGISAAATRQRAQAGKHGAVKVGEAWIFPRASVEADARPSRKGNPDA